MFVVGIAAVAWSCSFSTCDDGGEFFCFWEVSTIAGEDWEAFLVCVVGISAVEAGCGDGRERGKNVLD